MSDGDYGWDEQRYGTFEDVPELTYSYQTTGRRHSETPLADFGPQKAPVFSPSASFFRYEKDVRDWLTATICSHDQCGMNLLLQFSHDAKYLKEHIDRGKLSQGLADEMTKEVQILVWSIC